MLTRSLDNSPAADEIDYFVNTLAEDLYSLGWDERNLEKIEDAFNFYGSHADKWPTTKDITGTIKSRNYIFHQRQEQKQITHQETGEEKKKRKLVGIKAITNIRNILKRPSSRPFKKDYSKSIENEKHMDKALEEIEKHFEQYDQN